MLDFASWFERGLGYEDFLARYAKEDQLKRWRDVHGRVALTAPQQELLKSFVRQIKVLVLNGAWCGDCINQCPILDHFAAANDCIQLRFLDRDDNAELADALRICGGQRVPVVVFLSEDAQFVGLYGDRTLAKYRALASEQLGAYCPTGIGVDMPLLEAVTQDWLNEFERVHLMLRVSPRLRKLHDD